jgi:alpha-galactosidase
VRLRNAPCASGFGGGLTDGFYPPRAYREETVCFGKAREWDPENPSFTRWWVAQRFYTLSSGPDGRSSNPHLPLMQAHWQTEEGEMGLWAGLEWSGRWEVQFGSGSDPHFYFRGGPKVQNLVLDPGETIRLPRAHVGIYGGLGCSRQDGLNAIRRYVGEALVPDVEGLRPWPFLAYDHWFGIEERVSADTLRPQVDCAAELGLEYFVIDAGWYGGSSENFANGVGNWERVDEGKFPGGLEPFADYVRARGLRFGLWFEPERGRLGSDWVTQHPEWYWNAGSPVNFQLDLTQPAVQDHLIKVLSRWVERLDIRWLRWDCNQAQGPFWDKLDPSGKIQFAYLEGLYRVWDALLNRFPNLMIDNCAGGGTRIDFGTLRRSGTMVISDHAEDPHVCRIMQTGGARVFPANLMNSSIYVGENDGDEAVGPLELVSRMAGAVTLCGHIANWSPQQTSRVARYLDGYRSYRHLLMKDFYALAPYPRSEDDWDVVEFVDPETHEAVVLAYRMRGEHAARRVYPVRLDPAATYQIIDPFSARKLPLVTGQELLEKGLRLRLQPESALVRYLRPLR